MRNRKNLIFIVMTVCVLCIGGYFFNQPKRIKQDIDLNTGEWNTVYTIDELHSKKGAFFSVINDANNDDDIRVRVLDENKKVVCDSMLAQLGKEEAWSSQNLKNGYIIQAQPININGNYRITLLQHHFMNI